MQPHGAACMAHSAPAEEDVAERVDAVVELLQEECRPLGSRRATRAQHPRESDEPVPVCEPHRVRSQALPVFRRRAQHRYRLALVIAPVLPFRPLHSSPTVYAVASRRALSSCVRVGLDHVRWARHGWATQQSGTDVQAALLRDDQAHDRVADVDDRYQEHQDADLCTHPLALHAAHGCTRCGAS